MILRLATVQKNAQSALECGAFGTTIIAMKHTANGKLAQPLYHIIRGRVIQSFIGLLRLAVESEFRFTAN